MKTRKLFNLLSIMTMAAAGAFAIGAGMTHKKAESVRAAETWYYRGSGKGNNWGTADGQYVLNGSDYDSGGVNWSFTNGEEFVFTSTTSGWDKYGINGFSGSAGWVFSLKNSSDKFSNIVCSRTGNYNLSLSGGLLYADFADGTNFYYVGSDISKQSTAWTNYTAKPLALNGSAQQMSFKLNEEFKVRLLTNWDHNAYGFGDLKDGDTFYGSFSGNGGNLKCNVAANYNLSVVTSGHDIKVVLHGAVNHTVSVLDLYGDLLNVAHKAYVYNSNGNNGWPGTNMSKITGTTNMYSFTYWEKLTTIIFNQRGDGTKSGQTIDLAPQNGKCLILRHDTNSELKWNSNTWVSPEVAKFIDKYMKFETVDENVGGTGLCKSAGWFTAAKNAYEASSFASYRQELCAITIVVERLQAWAAANNGSFSITNNVGSFSANVNVFPLEIISGKNTNTITIILVSIVAVTAIGGYLFLRKRKENN